MVCDNVSTLYNFSHIPVFPIPFVEDTILSPLYVLCSFVINKLSIYSCVYSWDINSSIDLCIYFFSANTVLFWLLELCNIGVLKQGVGYLQLCSFFFKIALAGIFILEFFICFCEKCPWDFVRDCSESVDCFGYCGHFNKANSYNP